MAFSDDAIGFFLQLDDQLTPQLATAGQAYSKFVKSLDTYNQQAQRSANKGFGALASLVESFERLPKTAEKAYVKAVGLLKKKIKPLTQMVGLEFGAKAEKSLSRAIKQAVSDVFKKLKIRLTATAPLKRSKFFDTTVPMRSFYKTQPQPPDLMGGFQNLPRFAEGGEATGGGRKGIDDILALLREGEIVLPKDVAGILKEITKRKALPKGLAASVAGIVNLEQQMKDLQDAIELGLDPKAPGKFRESLVELEKGYGSLIKTAMTMKKGQKELIPILKDIKGRVSQFTKEGEKAIPVYKRLLEKILGPAKFIALATALKGAGEGISKLYAGATDAFTQIQGEQIDDYITNLNRANQIWGLSRDRLREVKQAGSAAQAALPGVGLTEMGEVMEALARKKFDAQAAVDLSPALAATMRATGATSDTLAAFADLAVKVGDLSQAQFERTLAITTKQARIAGRSAEEVFSQTTEKLRAMGQDFFSATAEQQQNMIGVMNALQTALPTGFSSMSDEVQNLVVAASQNTIEAQALAMKAFGKTQQEVKAALAAGDFQVLLRGMTEQFKDTQTAMEAQTLATGLGLEFQGKEFAKLGQALDENQDRMAATAEAMRFTGDATEFLSGEAANTTTLFQRFSDTMQGWAGRVNIAGVSGLELMDFFKEFNPVAIASIAHLGFMAIKFTAAALKMIFFGGVQSTTTVTVAGTTVAIETQNKSLLRSTINLAKNTAAWVIAKGALLATTIATHAVTAAQWLWNAAMSANPIGLIVLGVAALVAGIVLVVKNWDVVTRAFQGGISLITDLFSTVKGWVMSAVEWVASFGDKLLFLLGPIGAVIFVVKNFGAIWDWLKEKVMGVWDFIVGNISAGVEGVKGIFGSILGFVMAPLDIIKGFINRWIIEPLNTLASFDIPLVGPLQEFDVLSAIFPLPTLTHGGVATGPTLAMVGEVPEAIIPLDRLSEFTQEIAQAFPTRAAIEEAILVKLDPDTTDQPVRDAIEAQTMVLRQLLDAVVTGKPVVIPVSARAGGSAHVARAGVSPMTAGVAEGMF